jgi:hypothetical protein
MPRAAVILRKGVGKRGNGFLEQVEDHPLNRPPHRLREGLDLLPGIPGEANKAITH